jgi:hypothetical protein
MALAYGQWAAKTISAANTEESAYVVAAATKIVGQIIVANTSTSNNRTFRLAIVSGGGSAAAKDYLAYDVTIVPGETVTYSGLTLNAADEIRVQSNATSTTAGTGVIFQIYGEKIT